MTSGLGWRAVPVPERLARRPKDRRGYPIPANVFVDAKGDAHFSVQRDNAAKLLREKRCQLCGGIMPADDAWFVGNALAFFHPQAVFIDPPGHQACIEYALQVCPFIATPNYSKRIDGATVSAASDISMVFVEGVVTSEAESRVWCMGRSSGRARVTKPKPGVLHLRPARPWLALKFWRRGGQIDFNAAASVCPALSALAAEAVQ